MTKDDNSNDSLVPASSRALVRAGSQALVSRGLHDLATGERCCTEDRARFLFCLDHKCCHDQCPSVPHLDFALVPIEQVVQLPRIVPHIRTGPDDVAHGFPPGCSFCGESDPAQYGKPCPQRSCNTWYEILQVPATADENLINDAYRELAKEWSPERLPQHPDDKVFDGGYSETQMKWFNAAYAVLSDPAKRRQYDAELLLHKRFSGYKEWLASYGIRINSDQDTGETYRQYRTERKELYGEYDKAFANWCGTQTEVNMTSEEFMAEYKRKYPDSFNEDGTFSLTKARAAAERRFIVRKDQ